jgi:hypothetical protein
MARNTKWVFLGLLLGALFGTDLGCFFSARQAQAATINAASCSASDVQSAINSASNGDTVVVPSCSSTTWSTQVVISGKALTLQGQTTCTGSGDPNGGTNGVITCTDNTIINLTSSVYNGALSVAASAANFVTITGFTFIIGASSWSGQVQISGTHGQVSFRLHHCHFQWTASGAALMADTGYGLIDHVFWDDAASTSGTANVPLNVGGDRSAMGYGNWNDPTNFGSNQAIHVEQCYYVNTHTNLGSEGFWDAYYGAKTVTRFNTIVGNGPGGWHGTDSGGYRSAVYGEIYGNSISNSTGTVRYALLDTRGGTLLFFNNTLGGSTSWSSGIPLDYYRISQPTGVGTWGTAGAGLNWTPLSSTPTSSLAQENSLGSADWQASYSYAAQATIGPTSNNSGSYYYQDSGACTSGSSRPSFNQTIAGTTSDGSCTWTNVGGVVGTPPGGAGFCAANPDTACSADSTCAALQAGDTCSRYFDNNGGVYPYRDQPGRVHNQVLAPNYEWGNSGSQLPNPVLYADSTLSGIVVANRDYYNHATNFNGTSGTGMGTLASIPSTCTPQVAYWATDQGSWNQSGNGQGSGVLYQCSATNTWTAYYTPYTYPYSLTQTAPAPPTNVKAVAH